MTWKKTTYAAFAVALALTTPVVAQTVTGPIAGTPANNAGSYDLGKLGFVMEEFFLAGDATSYVPVGELTSDGKWTVKDGNKAAYTTRAIVIRPKDARKFNGTVLVEWLNVSAGSDGAPDWSMTHREILRSGYAWVGVSAQRAGIYGTGQANAVGRNLKAADPVRYEKLNHPGDAFSYDMFTQAGKVVRDGKVLGGLKARKVLAMGESQSAGRLTTYVNAVDPLTKAFEGYLIHSRGAGGASLGPDVPAPQGPVKFRSDMRAPVLTVEAETDVSGYHRARVPDSEKIRTWEIAGTAHGDVYMMFGSQTDSGSLSIEELAKGWGPVKSFMGEEFPKPINAAPQHHYMMNTAVDALNKWTSGGKAPAKASVLEMTAGDSPTFVRDEHGNAKGGVRSPWMEVPTAMLSGQTEVKTGFARSWGTTDPFNAAKLKQLYPGGKKDYMKKFEASLRKSISDGFILKADEKEIRELAAVMYPEK